MALTALAQPRFQAGKLLMTAGFVCFDAAEHDAILSAARALNLV